MMTTLAQIRKNLETEGLLEEVEEEVPTGFNVKAVWLNGQGGLSAGPYSRTIGNFPTEAEANEAAPQLFAKWREENPGGDGWKRSAWYEVEAA